VATSAVTTMPWDELLASWDLQQTGYLEHREARLTAMLDAIGTLVGEVFTALDIGCGPGSLSQRILDRYPLARCIGVDADPVLLTIGRHTQTRFGERLRWVDADLRSTNWVNAVGLERVDAVVSTTALHWLEPGQLFPLYRQVHRLLRKGGLLLNGDNMPFDPHQSACQRLADDAEANRPQVVFGVPQIPDWDRWWALAAEVPELQADIKARTRRRRDAESRYGARMAEGCLSLSTHLCALREAGFGEVGTIWQIHDDRVLLAVR
jgi:SAM-dependent methyltransferase